jgi:hypothetical protein
MALSGTPNIRRGKGRKSYRNTANALLTGPFYYTNFCIKNVFLIDQYIIGSGHILVYAFDVLLQIYKTAGYTQRDAALSILENNLYGLDWVDDVEKI